jgi:hypothetical protein
VAGTLTVSLVSTAGEQAARKAVPFALGPLGQATDAIDLPVPRVAGKFVLKAVAETAGKGVGSPVESRRPGQ